MTDEDEDEVATKKKKNHPKKKKVSKEAPKKTIKKKEAPKKNDTILKKDKCNLKKAGKNVKVLMNSLFFKWKEFIFSTLQFNEIFMLFFFFSLS